MEAFLHDPGLQLRLALVQEDRRELAGRLGVIKAPVTLGRYASHIGHELGHAVDVRPYGRNRDALADEAGHERRRGERVVSVAVAQDHDVLGVARMGGQRTGRILDEGHVAGGVTEARRCP